MLPSMASKSPSFVSTVLIILSAISLIQTQAGKPHLINIRSPNLYPEGLAYDPSAQHFIVGALHHRTIHSVSDSGVVDLLISDPTLPENVTFLGQAVDFARSPPTTSERANASSSLLSPPPTATAGARSPTTSPWISRATHTSPTRPRTSSGRSTRKGRPPSSPGLRYSRRILWIAPHPIVFCGLNGVAYVGKGYLLVVQSNTGKMFKVDTEDGTAREVLLPEDLTLADGIAIRSDGDVAVVVVSMSELWFLKSQDNWGEGVVYDKMELDAARFPTSVAVAAEDRVYVIYGHVDEGSMGSSERETFSIAEVRSEKESKEESVWIFVLIGLGLAYFMFWRFQMRQLVGNMNKKTN
ncbi:hypothetical protein M0R45_015765 [Rubus argutus]|uniref:Uncharacterized protein n=1 Tax=Rubus argutus TaxID=59490 RepID=A0AAW1XRU7_RUBAR